MGIVSSDSLQGKHYVYSLAYPDSMGGKVFYVGKGSGDRIAEHEREARRKKPENPYKCNIIRKIWAAGEQVVKRKLAHFTDEQEAFLYEIALIMLMDGLVNLTNGGDGSPGFIHSEADRRKMSEAKKNFVFTEEHRRNISKSMKGLQNTKGHVFSEKTRRKMSETRKGHSTSEETRQKISETLKGHVISEETRQKISKAKKRSAK